MSANELLYDYQKELKSNEIKRDKMKRITILNWLKRLIMWRGYLYRFTMRISHKFNWHYAPPIYPDGDTQLWCKWCGFRQTIKRSNNAKARIK